MDFAGALFAVGHKRVEFRALGLRKVYFPATRWHTPSWWSESTKILQLSKDLLEKPLRAQRCAPSMRDWRRRDRRNECNEYGAVAQGACGAESSLCGAHDARAFLFA